MVRFFDRDCAACLASMSLSSRSKCDPQNVRQSFARCVLNSCGEHVQKIKFEMEEVEP